MSHVATRRQFLGLVSCCGLVAIVPRQDVPQLPRIVSTELTPELIGKVRITVDGHDVTDDCFWAESSNTIDGRMVDGRVKVFKRTEDGHRYLWGSAADPDPSTRRDDFWHWRRFAYSDGKVAWLKPYPGYGEAAYDELFGDVRIGWKS